MERACRPLCGLQAGAASREDEDRLLQGCEPARRFPEPIVRLSRVQIPSEKSVGKRASCLCVLPARRQPEGVDVHRSDDPALDAHHSSDKSLPNLAEMYNPCIRGWINYYGNFYRTQLRSTLKRIDLYVIRWARRKFKRLRRKTQGARDWFDRLRLTLQSASIPDLWVMWMICAILPARPCTHSPRFFARSSSIEASISSPTKTESTLLVSTCPNP